MLSTLAVLLYRNTQDKTFLFYALYNISLLFYIISKNSYIVEILQPIIHKYYPLNWAIQIIYNSFLFYFGINFLNLKEYFPKRVARIDFFTRIMMITGSIGVFISILLNDYIVYFYAFTFGYLPILLFLSFYVLYLAHKTPKSIKYYYFAGVISYILFSVFAFVLSISNNYTLGIFTAISFFYIGIFIEQYAFIYGLRERIKNIYFEKIKYEKELATTQRKLNKELGNKLKTIEIKQKLTNLEFSMITSRMNSHFIFNALNSIKSYIIDNDKREATRYLSKFSEFIRKVLEISSVKDITLEDELYISQLYIDIENSRLDYTLDFKIVMNNSIPIKTIKVPPFILQPFLENAIWHGVASKKQKEITLSIVQEKTIIIEITDNGIGRKRAMEIKKQKSSYKKPIGISIVKQILTNYYGDNFSLDYVDLYDNQNTPNGTKVVLNIPNS